jgi:tetratricopeptide (TPR) repeat protein
VTLWSERYDREMADIFNVEKEVSRSIVNGLRLKGVGGQRRYNTNLEAYDLYLRASALANENGPGAANATERFERVIDLLGKVTTADSQFAPAYAMLANAYAHRRGRGRSRESSMRMREAAEKAIGLDPLLPEAHAILGAVAASELRWRDAESAFRRALELNPNLAQAHEDFAGFVLQPEGRMAEAIPQFRKAVELDPLSPSRRLYLAFALIRAGAHEEALSLTQPIFEANPTNEFAGQTTARALFWEGQRDRALAVLQRLTAPSHGYLGYVQAILGHRQEAEVIADEPDPAAARHQVLIYAALGDRDRCFKALQMLAEADDPIADLYPGEPELADLRDDPAMREFRFQRGLPVESFPLIALSRPFTH